MTTKDSKAGGFAPGQLVYLGGAGGGRRVDLTRELVAAGATVGLPMLEDTGGPPVDGPLAAALFGGKLYRGDTRGNDQPRVTVNGRDLKARLDLRNHSPAGFAWGYEGSGPAQLALAICADYLGDDARALRVYQDFKRAVISRLRDDNGNPLESWSMTGESVRVAVEAVERELPPETVDGAAVADQLQRLDDALRDDDETPFRAMPVGDGDDPDDPARPE